MKSRLKDLYRNLRHSTLARGPGDWLALMDEIDRVDKVLEAGSMLKDMETVNILAEQVRKIEAQAAEIESLKSVDAELYAVRAQRDAVAEKLDMAKTELEYMEGQVSVYHHSYTEMRAQRDAVAEARDKLRANYHALDARFLKMQTELDLAKCQRDSANERADAAIYAAPDTSTEQVRQIKEAMAGVPFHSRVPEDALSRVKNVVERLKALAKIRQQEMYARQAFREYTDHTRGLR